MQKYKRKDLVYVQNSFKPEKHVAPSDVSRKNQFAPRKKYDNVQNKNCTNLTYVKSENITAPSVLDSKCNSWASVVSTISNESLNSILSRTATEFHASDDTINFDIKPLSVIPHSTTAMAKNMNVKISNGKVTTHLTSQQPMSFSDTPVKHEDKITFNRRLLNGTKSNHLPKRLSLSKEVLMGFIQKKLKFRIKQKSKHYSQENVYARNMMKPANTSEQLLDGTEETVSLADKSSLGKPTELQSKNNSSKPTEEKENASHSMYEPLHCSDTENVQHADVFKKGSAEFISHRHSYINSESRNNLHEMSTMKNEHNANNSQMQDELENISETSIKELEQETSYSENQCYAEAFKKEMSDKLQAWKLQFEGKNSFNNHVKENSCSQHNPSECYSSSDETYNENKKSYRNSYAAYTCSLDRRQNYLKPSCTHNSELTSHASFTFNPSAYRYTGCDKKDKRKTFDSSQLLTYSPEMFAPKYENMERFTKIADNYTAQNEINSFEPMHVLEKNREASIYNKNSVYPFKRDKHASRLSSSSFSTKGSYFLSNNHQQNKHNSNTLLQQDQKRRHSWDQKTHQNLAEKEQLTLRCPPISRKEQLILKSPTSPRTTEELFVAIYESKKRMNIKSDPDIIPTSHRSSICFPLYQPTSIQYKVATNGGSSQSNDCFHQMDIFKQRYSWPDGKPLLHRGNGLRNEGLFFAKPTSMQEFKRLLLQMQISNKSTNKGMSAVEQLKITTSPTRRHSSAGIIESHSNRNTSPSSMQSSAVPINDGNMTFPLKRGIKAFKLLHAHPPIMEDSLEDENAKVIDKRTNNCSVISHNNDPKEKDQSSYCTFRYCTKAQKHQTDKHSSGNAIIWL